MRFTFTNRSFTISLSKLSKSSLDPKAPGMFREEKFDFSPEISQSKFVVEDIPAALVFLGVS